LEEVLLPISVRDGFARLDYLGPHDHAWLRVLIGEFERFEGRRQKDLDRRLKEPLPCPTPWKKFLAATLVLKRLWKSDAQAPVPPVLARAEVFRLAAAAPRKRGQVLAIVARRLETTPDALEQALFSDVPGERIVRAPAEPPTPPELALRVNLALAQSVLRRAATVEISAHENARAIFRQARLRGLICIVRPGANAAEARLSISGPFALFRHTLVYGRALSGLVPLLARSPRFHLSASVLLNGEKVVFELTTGDPLFPAKETRRYDSRLEERFARDMARNATDWDLIREPEAVAAAGSLIFPDFLLRHRVDPTRAWFIEIVGFWTTDYLSKKLRALRAARIQNLILCIDEKRQCSEADFPAHARVLRYRRRIDVKELLELVEAVGPQRQSGSAGTRLT